MLEKTFFNGLIVNICHIMSKKCVFLDRDGVINEDSPDYVFKPEKFKIIPGVPEAIEAFKRADYLVIVITNQSGIAQGIYAREDMLACHRKMQSELNSQIDHIYYAPFHESVSNSLSRKPGSLMFERAIAKFNIDPKISWMIGDRARDIIPARALGIKTIQVGGPDSQVANYSAENLIDASRIVLNAK